MEEKKKSVEGHVRTRIPRSFKVFALGSPCEHKSDVYDMAKRVGREDDSGMDITNQSWQFVNGIMKKREAREQLDEIYNKYKDIQPAIISIASPFADGLKPNPIPATTAMLLSENLAFKAENEWGLRDGGFTYQRIIQSGKRYKKTGEGFYTRAIAYSGFSIYNENDLDGIKNAIIVDDHVSAGGTVADAYAYLKSRGINPVGCVSTTGFPNVHLWLEDKILENAVCAFGIKGRALEEDCKESDRQKGNRRTLDSIVRDIFSISEASFAIQSQSSVSHSVFLLTNFELMGLTRLFNAYRQQNKIGKEDLKPEHIEKFGASVLEQLEKARENSEPIREIPIPEIKRRIAARGTDWKKTL